MKPTARFVVTLFAVLVFIGYVFWANLVKREGASFASGSFHAEAESELDDVYADFRSYLISEGFEVVEPPANGAIQFGVISSEAKQEYFVRSLGKKNIIRVRAQNSPKVLRTSIGWHAHGFQGTRAEVEQEATQLALNFQDWFSSRNEVNTLPKKFKDRNRLGLEKRLARIE